MLLTAVNLESLAVGRTGGMAQPEQLVMLAWAPRHPSLRRLGVELSQPVVEQMGAQLQQANPHLSIDQETRLISHTIT